MKNFFPALKKFFQALKKVFQALKKIFPALALFLKITAGRWGAFSVEQCAPEKSLSAGERFSVCTENQRCIRHLRPILFT
ncbi:MAG: hypothetical protein ACI4TQ_00435 [Alloprevotella sp.]